MQDIGKVVEASLEECKRRGGAGKLKVGFYIWGELVEISCHRLLNLGFWLSTMWHK
jgi:hypothetical protein